MKSVWLQRAYWLVLGIAAFPTVFATTFSNRPLGAVVQEADFILRGKTGTSHSDWGKGEDQRAIFTYTEFEISEVLKGGAGAPQVGDRILLRQPGGQKDGIEMSVAATAAFAPGEDVVVLVAAKDNADSGFDVLNFTAGKYNVVEENGETMLVNSLGGADVYDPSRADRGKNVSYNSRISLDAFRQIAKGEARPEAQQSQFAPTKEQKPHSHDHSPVAQNAPVASPTVEVSSPALQGQETDSPSYWIPISFGVIFLAGAFGLWRLVSRKGDDS